MDDGVKFMGVFRLDCNFFLTVVFLCKGWHFAIFLVLSNRCLRGLHFDTYDINEIRTTLKKKMCHQARVWRRTSFIGGRLDQRRSLFFSFRQFIHGPRARCPIIQVCAYHLFH